MSHVTKLDESIVQIDSRSTVVGFTFGGFSNVAQVPDGLSPADVVRMLPRGSEAIGIASLGTITDPDGKSCRVKVVTAFGQDGVMGSITYPNGHREELVEPPQGHLADVIRDQLTY